MYSEVKYTLLKNPHKDIAVSLGTEQNWYTASELTYYHYNCDQTLDCGWGCGYRTLQTMCAYVQKKWGLTVVKVPSIREIQKILVRIGDKPASFVGSKQWIGVMEASYVIDCLYNVPCKILHITQGDQLKKYMEDIRNYFDKYAGFLMMGGDADAASKGIAGLHISKKNYEFSLLVVDPHFQHIPKSSYEIIQQGFIRWQKIDEFDKNSFYNICMPCI